ncbi:MAG: bifunctional riboflavin kinase/FAD synthetase [Acetatifactor sp.]
MKIIKNTLDFALKEPTAVTIGKFDGVHLGHRKLLGEILNKRPGLKSCVFTFDPAPAVLFGLSDGKELTTREEKRLLFESLGVDVLIEFPLTRESAAMEPEDFVRRILVDRLNAGFIAAGEDLSFGNRGAGDAALLRRMGESLGFETDIVEKIWLDGAEISSTRVREAVEKKDMPLAARLLGSPYTVLGEIVHGNHIGSTLGFPTINLLPGSTKLLPGNGVYFSRVVIGGRTFRGITNVGCKPTVEDRKVMGVETYLYDFDGDLYGQQAAVELYEFSRPEQRFASLEDLRCQLQQDIRNGAAYWRDRVEA